MRLFMAVALPPAARQALASVASRLGREVPGFRPVGIDAMHVTLRFLGEVAGPDALALRGRLREARLGSRAFAAIVGGYGQFPPGGRPRVLFAGLRSGGPEFEALWKEIGELTRGVGNGEPEEQFVPHVTLARAKGPGVDPSGSAFASITAELDALSLPAPVDAVGLYESMLRPGGPRYTTLEEVRCAP